MTKRRQRKKKRNPVRFTHSQIEAILRRLERGFPSVVAMASTEFRRSRIAADTPTQMECEKFALQALGMMFEIVLPCQFNADYDWSETEIDARASKLRDMRKSGTVDVNNEQVNT